MIFKMEKKQKLKMIWYRRHAFRLECDHAAACNTS